MKRISEILKAISKPGTLPDGFSDYYIKTSCPGCGAGMVLGDAYAVNKGKRTEYQCAGCRCIVAQTVRVSGDIFDIVTDAGFEVIVPGPNMPPPPPPVP